MTEYDMKNMYIHESIKVFSNEGTFMLTRVVGGMLYAYETFDATSGAQILTAPCFVPFPSNNMPPVG